MNPIPDSSPRVCCIASPGVAPIATPDVEASRSHLPIRLLLALGILFGGQLAAAETTVPVDLRPRLIVETDLGGDKDDQATFVRLLMHSNLVDLEAILLDRADDRFQVDGAALNPSGATDALDMAYDYIDAYGQIRSNLLQHASGFPSVADLKAITVHATDADTAGRDLIISVVDAADSRPVWYGNWGSNSGTISNLRRALDWVQANRSETAYREFARRIRIASLDGSGSTRQQHEAVIQLHIETGYPDFDGGRWYHRFDDITQSAGGFSYTRDITSNHGQLGAWYPGVKEGDSWCIVHLFSQAWGLSVPTRTTWGGVGGRYATVRTGTDFPDGKFWWNQNQDTWNGSTNRDNTAKRFAAVVQHQFAGRFDWAMDGSGTVANHPPVAAIDGDTSGLVIRRFVRPGQAVSFSAAASSDPDVGDILNFQWTHYGEVDSYPGSLGLSGADTATVSFTVPADADGTDLHLYLAVTDSRDSTPVNNQPSLTIWRRVVLSVRSQLKILPLGDSITDGSHNGAYPGAYRIKLWELLQADGSGFSFDLVGDKANGPTIIDQDHEGYIGYRIDQFFGDDATDVDLATKLANHQPDVILLLLGTNDAIQNTDLANVHLRHQRLLHLLSRHAPDALVLFGNLPPMADSGRNTRADAINAQLPSNVTAAYHEGLWADLLDFNSLLTLADLADGTHPSAGGYAKMAEAWYAALGTRFIGGDPGNTPPVIDSLSADPAVVSGTSTVLNVAASDVDGDSFSYTWSVNSQPEGAAASFSDATNATPTLTFDRVGSYTVQVTVSDGSGGSAAADLDLTVTQTASQLTVTP